MNPLLQVKKYSYKNNKSVVSKTNEN